MPGPVAIEKLSDGVCELELFPTRHLTQWKPIIVNVFASGRVVITGVKDELIINNVILPELLILYNKWILD